LSALKPKKTFLTLRYGMKADKWGFGLDLANEIHAAIERALEKPLGYLLLRRHPHVRRVLARRFPYRIFYIVRWDALIVFAVLHAAQDERHWLKRL
jgi:plasmid stabilization system protein ParE